LSFTKQNLSSFRKNFRRPLFSHFLHFFTFQSLKTSKRCRYNCTAKFFWPFFYHSFSKFTGFHPSFPLLHFQIYNYNCTNAILQLQITFYNCRNCHQLHVKICSG